MGASARVQVQLRQGFAKLMDAVLKVRFSVDFGSQLLSNYQLDLHRIMEGF